jgi:superoxide dismutase, Cu-Zn family
MRTHPGLLFSLTLLLVACSREQPEGAPREPDNTTAAPAEKSNEPAAAAPAAAAQIAPTQGNTVTGALALAQSSGGVHITGSIQGLKPDAEFGFHVHEKGDCTAPDGSSAGGHFNPTQAQHGNPTGPTHHAGDMPNIKSDDQGVAQVDVTAGGTSLTGDPGTDIMGKAIVVHESPDDYATQPSGNSGKRVACGVIAAPSPQ